MLKQITARERARRRREFVRQKCRRYGWEPFGVEDSQMTTTMTSYQLDKDLQQDSEEISEQPAGSICSSVLLVCFAPSDYNFRTYM